MSQKSLPVIWEIGSTGAEQQLSVLKTISEKATMTLVFGMAALSGAAGLAHQMIWTRRLVDLFGASPLTFSKVIGAFFLGLALGSAYAARSTTGARSPWKLVAAAEIGVALLALPVFLTPFLSAFLTGYGESISIFRAVAPFGVVTPPAFAMGLVIPWLLRALNANRSVRNLAVWIYALNTLGGVAGICSVLLFLLPRFGLTTTGLLVCACNILVGLAALYLARSHSVHPMREVEEPISSAPLKRGFPALSSLLSFFSGFLVLALEVVLQHQFAQVTINSLFSSGTVLVWVLVSLGVGAMIVPQLVRWFKTPASRYVAVLLAVSVCSSVQPFLLTYLRDGVSILPYELSAGPYTWEVSKLGLIAICPLLVAAGLLFPLLLRESAEQPSASIRQFVGLLLAWNGLGGWLGSEFAQYVLVPSFGLWKSVQIIGLIYATLGIAVWWSFVPGSAAGLRPSLGKGLLSGGVVVMVLLVSIVRSSDLHQASLKEGERLAALRAGPEGVVATVESGPGDWRMLFNNSYTLGGSKAQPNQERQAHLPLLLHGNARTVGVLGVATGSTVAGASLHPTVDRIDAIELSPTVLRYAEEFFGPYNRNVFTNSRVRFFAEDARWVMATRPASYDVVIGDLFLPWRTGEGRLFSKEHFAAVRDALKPDGLFCQWLPMFQLTRPQYECIVRTFLQVFPNALLSRGDFYTELPILGLVGGKNLSQLDWQQIAVRCEGLRNGGQASDPLVRHPEGVAMMLIGSLADPGPGPINTLANAWLEWDAGRNILGMRTPWFIGVPCAEYVRDIHRQAQALLTPSIRKAHDAGQFFLTLEIAAKLKLDVLQNLIAQVPDRLPLEMRKDVQADWQQWPMRVKPQRL